METNRKPKFDANIIYLNEKLFERLQKFKVGDIISAGANVGPHMGIINFNVIEEDEEKFLEVNENYENHLENLFKIYPNREVTIYNLIKKVGKIGKAQEIIID
ncbi:hypothetical protein [Methanococcus maripaludis]|uniref:Uncharacterized protein n=1 Tax=Methanococcus maripaludis (strain DSM 14266 / JCM 13030 / NBRC 101832 / S2 / LL) TaxID=267377 RepID=Q6LZ66_METMP|nr:hypothetical protein [Methanococcus maripaludis]CAF30319.1 hypothetical protein MMP0763 [Methanococcus maripaludis S2]